MLIEISKETESEVVAIQQYDSVGAWGYVLINKGEIVDSYFSEDDYDYENMIFDKMKTKGINNILLLFREVIQMKDENWMFVKKNYDVYWLCCCAKEECIYAFSITLGLTQTKYQSLYDYIIEACNIPFTINI